MASFYEILGVATTASAAEIRQAYLRIARERHPDRVPDADKTRAQEALQKATEAFNTLTNQSARRKYDEELRTPPPRTPEELGQDAFARGSALLAQGDAAGAAELLRAAAHHLPADARLRATLARALAKTPGGARLAAQELEQATQLAPGVAAYQAELAALLHSQGLRVRAKRAIEAALRLSPQDPTARRLAAELEGEEPAPPPGEGGGLLSRLRRKP